MTPMDRRPRVSLNNVPCRVCLATEASDYAEVRDRLFGLVPGTFRLVRCASCGCVFQHPMPAPESLPSFYPDEYWWNGSVDAPGRDRFWLLRLESVYREFVSGGHVRFLRRCARARPGGGRRLLDIGCGSGTILSLAQAAGFDAYGMDASEAAVAAARRNHRLEVRRGSVGDPLWGQERFDFVTMFHVLEHLTEPESALNYAASLLRPEGSLIVQVPNVESFQSKAFGAVWYGLDPPRHLVNFSPGGLRTMLTRSGFRIVRQARFSLRDNPASIASSLVPGLDPIGRRGRRVRQGAGAAASDLLYLGLFLASIPFALTESLVGRGGTIWIEGQRASDLEAAAPS